MPGKGRLEFSPRNKEIIEWLERLKTHLETKANAKISIEWDVGEKWIKVWVRHSTGRSIYCFICPEGKMYKPEGVKRPHPIPRGSIDTTEPTSCDESGAWLYLQRRGKTYG